MKGRPANDVLLVVRMPKDLRENCARQANLRDMSLSSAVRLALEAWLLELARDELRTR